MRPGIETLYIQQIAFKFQNKEDISYDIFTPKTTDAPRNFLGHLWFKQISTILECLGATH